jgi:transposase InsO family protein
MPNQRWAGDTTELHIGESGRLFLAVIIDLFSRFAIGWALSAVNDRHLAIKALEMAVRRRCPDEGLLHHSDQGSPGEFKRWSQHLGREELRWGTSRRRRSRRAGRAPMRSPSFRRVLMGGTPAQIPQGSLVAAVVLLVWRASIREIVGDGSITALPGGLPPPVGPLRWQA